MSVTVKVCPPYFAQRRGLRPAAILLDTGEPDGYVVRLAEGETVDQARRAAILVLSDIVDELMKVDPPIEGFGDLRVLMGKQ